ncbi:MAG: hypothetical protein K0U41_06780 [Gammaproteobacteria bacterium]|nr:hypothetical protein [Gammaproteobacteria bacterium]
MQIKLSPLDDDFAAGYKTILDYIHSYEKDSDPLILILKAEFDFSVDWHAGIIDQANQDFPPIDTIPGSHALSSIDLYFGPIYSEIKDLYYRRNMLHRKGMCSAKRLLRVAFFHKFDFIYRDNRNNEHFLNILSLTDTQSNYPKLKASVFALAQHIHTIPIFVVIQDKNKNPKAPL